MGRPRLGTAAHTVIVSVRLTPREAEALDAARGRRTRSGYLRSLIGGGGQVAKTTNTKPTVRSSTSSSPAPDADRVVEFRKPERHLHRYKRTGDPLRHVKGAAVYLYRCDCGDTKEE